MKVGIITFHFVNNFGGVLQAYALQRALEKNFSVEVEIIDYKHWFISITDLVRLFPITRSAKEILSGIRTFKLRFSRRNRFTLWTRERLHLSKELLDCLGNIKYEYSNKYDKYICGSDQIWNPVITLGLSPNYFLRFEKCKNKKIAYAPSFGITDINKYDKRKAAGYVQDIDFLSIREESGNAIIRQIMGSDAEVLIDPTFLLDKTEWEIIANNPLKTSERYILVYIMQPDSQVYEYAKRIKDEKGIRVVEISRYGYKSEVVDETLIDVGPGEFLGLFRDADCICTNSYHGLVYSIIFEKEFCVIPSKRFSTRIFDLIERLNIIALKDSCIHKTLLVDYDRKHMRDLIANERKKSMAFLQRGLGCADDRIGKK